MELQRIEPAEIIAMAPRLDELINEFIGDQDIRTNSADLYRRTLKQYFNWVSCEGLAMGEIQLMHIVKYKADLLASGKSSLTVGTYITTVRRFYAWAEAKKYYPNIAKGVKTPKRAQQFKKQPLTASESTELLNQVSNPGLGNY